MMGSIPDLHADRQLQGNGAFLRTIWTGCPPALRSTLLLLTLLAPGRAERLPLRIYSTADGLPSNQVHRVRRDSRGFLWFCTGEGLSRFDGYTFTNYGTEQGLPDQEVIDFLETRSGEYWVATLGGVAHFNPKPYRNTRMFTVYHPGETALAQQVNALLEDRQGVIWVATNAGVFQLVQAGGQWALRRADAGLAIRGAVRGFLEDHEGNVWVVVFREPGRGDTLLCRRSPSGRVDVFQDDFLRGNRIGAMLEDRQAHIWLGTYRGLALMVPHPQVGGRLIERVYGKREGLGSDEVRYLFQSSDGRLWADTSLMVSDASGKQISFEAYGAGDPRFGGVWEEDRDGNLWRGGRGSPETDLSATARPTALLMRAFGPSLRAAMARFML